MITGFAKETHELTEDERKLIKPFIIGLRSKIGKENAVTNKQIRAGFSKDPSWSIEIPDARVRKVINYIRSNGLVKHLCANSRGYYVAKDKKEFEDYLNGLSERINSQQAIYDKLKEQYNERFK